MPWPASENDLWPSDTSPFAAVPPPGTATFVLRQVSDFQFELESPFQYTSRDGTVITVTSSRLHLTDLATVPWFLQWFVSRHGRHTPAALVHDQLCKEAGDDYGARAAADTVFLQAMDELVVPPVRSRMMWSAVVADAQWTTKPWGRLTLVLWVLLSLAGTALLIWSVTASSPWFFVALAGPFAGAILWGKQYWAGVVAGYAVWIVAVPALASILVHYLIYWPAEKLVQVGRALLPRNTKQDMPGPVSYPKA